MTVVLDYGMGNLRSVQKAVEHLGHACAIQGFVGDAERLIIPGVGAFGAAMERIGPLADEIKAYVQSGRPLLGICLGQQLLFEHSEEHGGCAGLGILPGTVRYLQKGDGCKVPNIGWSAISPRDGSLLLKGTSADEQVYFVHSLYTDCSDETDVAATAEHSAPFPAAIERDNVWATQFHPEKSGKVGLKILRNFLEC